MIENIFLTIFLLLAFYYGFFLIKIYLGLNKLPQSLVNNTPSEFISIIVPFRNEAKNILTTLSNLSNQNYPPGKYEIIFVDDSSTDNSLHLLEHAIRKENVSVFSVPKEYSINAHKKRAIRFGIEKSRGEIIVTTDADCIHSKDWLKNLLKFMDGETGFISGPVEFIESSNYFGKMQRLEFAGLVITGAGLIGTGKPIICNAANIAYRKKAFLDVGGFTYQMSLSSGDDELLMQKIHSDTGYKIKFALDKNAIVLTTTNPTLKDFYHQRKRWASKGLFYGDNLLLLKLIIIFLFYLSLIIQPLLGFILSAKFFLTFLFSVLVKISIEYSVLKKGIGLLFDLKMIKPFFITETLQIPYILVSGFMGMFGNFVWKDRKIRR